MPGMITSEAKRLAGRGGEYHPGHVPTELEAPDYCGLCPGWSASGLGPRQFLWLEVIRASPEIRWG